jgi:ADP-ribosyl-[dinitrogen reductase] hydrolase
MDGSATDSGDGGGAGPAGPNAGAGAGVLLGLGCGDALGRPVEFMSAAAIERQYGTVTEMLADGTHCQPAGTITDDTELALCIARSLLARAGFDPENVAERFVEWFESGPFDIGVTTSTAIRGLRDGVPWDEAGERAWNGTNAGNGSVMRCAPLALAFRDDEDTLIEASKRSSRITHADPRCVYGCAALNLTIAGLLDDRDRPLRHAIDRVSSDAPDELVNALEPLATRRDDPDRLDPDTLASSGFVIDTLQTALFHGLRADTAERGIIMAVNEGDDTDTVGAVTGAIVGARFGQQALPERWIAEIDAAPELRWLGDALANPEAGAFDLLGADTPIDGTAPRSKQASTSTEEDDGR